MTNLKLLYNNFKFLIKISFFQSSIFLALSSNFIIKRKIPLYTFDTFLKVAAPAKLTNNNNLKNFLYIKDLKCFFIYIKK